MRQTPGSRRPASLRILVWSALLLFVFGCASAEQRGEIDAVRNEIQVGRALAARLARRYGLSRNEAATRYLNRLGRRIANQTARSELTFFFGILDSDEINAFACPGGYVLFTRGALRAMRDEGELAFVIAHEISHVALKHSGDLQRSGGFVDFVAGLLGGGNIMNAAVRQATDQLETTLLESGRQRDLEFQADEAGLMTAAALGFAPDAANRYLERIARETQAGTFSRTHPGADERVSRIKLIIAAQGLTGAERTSPDFIEFKRVLE